MKSVAVSATSNVFVMKSICLSVDHIDSCFTWHSLTQTGHLSTNHCRDTEYVDLKKHDVVHSNRVSSASRLLRSSLSSSVKVSLSSFLNKSEEPLLVVTEDIVVNTAAALHSHSVCQSTFQRYEFLLLQTFICVLSCSVVHCRWMRTSSGPIAELQQLLCDSLTLSGCRLHCFDSSWWINKKHLLSRFRLLLTVNFIITWADNRLFRLDYLIRQDAEKSSNVNEWTDSLISAQCFLYTWR